MKFDKLVKIDGDLYCFVDFCGSELAFGLKLLSLLKKITGVFAKKLKVVFLSRQSIILL